MRKVWWRLFFELSAAIDEYEGEEERTISQRMGNLIWVFNAACFRNASSLRYMPKITAGTRKPRHRSFQEKLKLVPPILATEQKPNKHRTST